MATLVIAETLLAAMVGGLGMMSMSSMTGAVLVAFLAFMKINDKPRGVTQSFIYLLSQLSAMTWTA